MQFNCIQYIRLVSWRLAAWGARPWGAQEPAPAGAWSQEPSLEPGASSAASRLHASRINRSLIWEPDREAPKPRCGLIASSTASSLHQWTPHRKLAASPQQSKSFALRYFAPVRSRRKIRIMSTLRRKLSSRSTKRKEEKFISVKIVSLSFSSIDYWSRLARPHDRATNGRKDTHTHACSA